MEYDRLVGRAADTLRVLSSDMIELAQSGHPGLPLGCAEVAAVLWTEFLRHDPSCPEWPDRDRFVLSAGHGSALLYAVLYLTGYDLTEADLAQYRQLHSRAPGHPERGRTPGVEVTTGPLGQGFATAVGLALAERMSASRFNRPDFNVVNHRTWVIASDGDLMEGVTAEAASLAGHLRLGRLKLIYDSNRIAIEGPTALTFTEDVRQRFQAYGWRVTEVDGHDVSALRNAFLWATEDDDQPSLIIAHTQLAHKSAMEGQASAHGAPLGPNVLSDLKRRLGFSEMEPLTVPDEVRRFFRERQTAWERQRQSWEECRAQWALAYPELHRQWEVQMSLGLPEGLEQDLPAIADDAGTRKLPTRIVSGQLLQVIGRRVDYLVGGSADLAPSVRSYIDGVGDVEPGRFTGRNLHFGVREHAMGAMLNGIALHGGWRPYGSTYLVFADYMKPAIRAAAMMHLPVILVFTHDSIYVGEDGPTHQPVEQLESLRSIPGVEVWRPCDAEETRDAWMAALGRHDGPTMLILSRQALPTVISQESGAESVGGYVSRGARVVAWESDTHPELTLVATGSEVELALKAAKALESHHIPTRVVSVPCRERFAAVAPEERRRLLGHPAPCVVVEASTADGWAWLLESKAQRVALGRFGESGPGPEVAQALGLTVERLVEVGRQLTGR